MAWRPSWVAQSPSQKSAAAPNCSAKRGRGPLYSQHCCARRHVPPYPCEVSHGPRSCFRSLCDVRPAQQHQCQVGVDGSVSGCYICSLGHCLPFTAPYSPSAMHTHTCTNALYSSPAQQPCRGTFSPIKAVHLPRRVIPAPGASTKPET